MRGAWGRACVLLVAHAVCLLLLLGLPAATQARPGGGAGFGGAAGGGGYGGAAGGGGYGGAAAYGGSHPSGISGGKSTAAGWVIAALLLGAMGFGFAWMRRARQERIDRWYTSRPAQPGALEGPGLSLRRRLERIRRFDPDFSAIVLGDFLHALYQKAHELRGVGRLDDLRMYLSPEVRRDIAVRSPRVKEVHGVVVGAMRYTRVEGLDKDPLHVQVTFEANYTEVAGDRETGYYVVERWTIERPRRARSRPPERARTFDCPGCGAALEDLYGDVCDYCGAHVTTGELDWRVVAVEVLEQLERPPALTGDAEERGTDLPTVRDDDVQERLEQLEQRDPDFDEASFESRVELVFRELNAAWVDGDRERMRPFLSDAAFEAMCYWLDAYERQGLQNVVVEPRITQQEIARVSADKWYDAITVRVFATCHDYTVRVETGETVGGSRSRPRPYSEYWTLVRSAGASGESTTEPACPSCGAPLSVNQGGVCEYCDARVTTGEFDWVLSRIEQDESYRG